MSPFVLAMALSLAGSFLGVLVASGIYLFGDEARERLVAWLVSYAVGSLLGLSLLHLVPKALETLPSERALGALLLGILTFFILEKLVLWRHCHDTHECEVHSSAASLVIVGDAFHTFVDGAIIAAATLTSPWLGVTTALAAAAHEIPQELGDAAILLKAGYGRVQALAPEPPVGTRRPDRRAVRVSGAEPVADRAAVRDRVCRGQLPVRRDVGSDPEPAQGPRRGEPGRAGPPHQRRTLHAADALTDRPRVSGITTHHAAATRKAAATTLKAAVNPR